MEKKERIVSIDCFRGLCMMTVVLAFIITLMPSSFGFLDILFEHGDDGLLILGGIALADLGAPSFIFIVGMTLSLCLESHEKKVGTDKAYLELAERFFALMGLGSLLNAIEDGYMEMYYEAWTFAEMDVNKKWLVICFPIAVLFFILNVASSFKKESSFHKIMAKAFRISLIVMGIAILYFQCVSAAEKVAEKVAEAEGKEFQSLYGGYIWDTLENIGLAGLIALLVVRLPRKVRLAAVGFGYFIVLVFAQHGGFSLLNSMIEGGLYGAISWAGIAILGSVFMELRGKKEYFILSAALLIPSIILALLGYYSLKRGCFPVYAMFSAGIASLIFALFDYCSEKPSAKLNIFECWGGSSIVTYVVNYLVCLLIGFILEVNGIELPMVVALLILVVLFGLYTLMNINLYKKQKHISL